MIAWILNRKGNRTDFDDRVVDGSIHPDADGVDSAERSAFSTEVDPACVAVLVEGCSQVVGRIRKGTVKAQRNGQFVPAVDAIAHHAQLVVTGFCRKANLESLRCAGFKLQYNKVEPIPVGRDAGRNILDGHFFA